jgi:hypothetical protein
VAWLVPGARTVLAARGSVVSSGPGRKRIALLATEVRRHSHAQHFIDRFLEGYGWEGRHYRPPVQLVSLYVDQFPEGDLARERSGRHRVPIYPSIAEALTRGGSTLAVDGVVLIGEHGKYPRNTRGQTLYPRYEFFKEVVRVFEGSDRSVPVFNDKHLSTEWDRCREMVEDSRRLGFAFLAGSSLPVTWRIPSIDVPRGMDLGEGVCACYGGMDSYDFHGYETAQCMAERRRGGETGVRSVQVLKGPAVWDRMRRQPETTRLLLAALSRSHSLRAPAGYTSWLPTLDWLSQSAPDPIASLIEHRDGFRTTLFLLNGLIQDFNFAGGDRKTGRILSCQMNLPMPGTNATTADFFNPLVHHIEDLIQTGRAAYPVERTLLTSGMTLFGVESLHRGQVLLETPELDVTYRVGKASTFWRT